MPMGAHAAPSVRRGPSSPALYTLLVALAALISTHAVVVSSGAIDSSAESLLKFKSALANADGLGSWSSSTNPCSGSTANWFGVLCYNGQVWGLQLENMGLAGQIDVDSLVPLRMLRTLSFMNNNFEGPMPDWKKLGALKSLFISNNHFSGEIPADTFEGMNYLKKVHLANNEFTGNIPTSLSTPRLLELTLENNKFTGPIPEFRDGIKLLNVSNNQLEGPLPKSVAKMDPSSFSGNKGLCGKPLGNGCDFPDVLPGEEDPTSDSDTPSDASPEAKGSSSKVVIIIVSVLVAIVVLVLFIVLLACLRRRRKQKKSVGDGIIAPSSYNQKNRSPPTNNHPPVVVDQPADTNVKHAAKKADTGKLSFVREDREKFDLQDLLRASAEVLGSGNFGSSYKAVLMDGQAVVVKRFKQMNNICREDFHEHMRRLGRLQHSNLLPLVAYYYRKEEKLLVFDHVHNGSLAGRLHGKHSAEKPGLDWPTRLNIVKGVAKGLLYLQNELPSLTVAHGHLKSANVLLDKSYNPLLMDYSLSPVVNPEQVQHLLVSYKSPEYAQTGRVTKKTDVWCLGILILEILTGKLPANYVLAQGAGYDSVLAAWVSSIVREDNVEVFDKEMGNTENSESEMRKLLKIGAACCDEDLAKRSDLKEVVDMIEELKERDG